eukprot:s2642_g14.t1
MALNDFDAVFRRSLAQSSFNDDLQLPWEVGFWKTFFDQEVESSPYAISRPQFLSEPDASEPQVKRARNSNAVAAHWRDVVKADTQQNWTEKRDADFQAALRRWLQTLSEMPRSIKVVDLLMQLESVSDRLRMLRDLFWKKSPHTLKKRIHSLLRYIAFLNESLLPFPGTEPMLYNFLQKELRAGAPTSRLQSVMQALSFMEHVLDVSEVNPLTSSKRCMGASSKLGNGPTRQADPFLVEHVAIMHRVLANTELDKWDRLFSGCLLAMIYSRSRWNDLQQAEEVLIDTGPDGCCAFLEFKVAVHKCRHSSVFRNTFLPAVAVGAGVVHDDWANTWMSLRYELGISFAAGFPTMPAPDDLAQPTVRPLWTDEMKAWTAVLLDQQGADISGKRYTSHSCKTTALSWASKYGVNWEDRCVLGGHVAHLKSPIVYSRDAMARPLYMLEVVVQAIRSGEFFPDATRSGRFSEPWRAVDASGDWDKVTQESGFQEETFTPDEVEGTDLFSHSFETLADCDNNPFPATKLFKENTDLEPVLQQSEPLEAGVGAMEELVVGTEEEVPTTSSESEEDAAQLSQAHRPVNPPKVPDGFRLIQHLKLKTLHLQEEQNRRVLVCGRLMIERYGDPVSFRWDTPCCHFCWKRSKQDLDR